LVPSFRPMTGRVRTRARTLFSVTTGLQDGRGGSPGHAPTPEPPPAPTSACRSRRGVRLVVPSLSALALSPRPGLAQLTGALPAAAAEALGCDPTDPALCLFPFPNDRWTTADSTTDTGLRVDLPVTAMPRNGTDVAGGELGGEGKPIDPREWNRNDGFSPGSMVLTSCPASTCTRPGAPPTGRAARRG
jgi:hypothetical protein